YDRYTYYRMLAQLGTDSGPESPAAVPKQLTRWVPIGGSNLLMTLPQHGYFVGDRVTITGGNPPNYQRTFKINSVLNASNFVLEGAALFPPPAPAIAVDPFANAKIDLNYDNINSSRESFTN